MPTATATALSPAVQKYKNIEEFLRTYLVERNEFIQLMMLAAISGVDGLFLGDPGVAKTMGIELFVDHCIESQPGDLYQALMMKDMSADEVLGPQDIMARKVGDIMRHLDGFAPRSRACYWDEVFKSSPTLANPLLGLMADRKIKVGKHVIDCSQLIVIYMSSNELSEREDLAAFRDRIGFTYVVQPVRTPEGRRRVTDIQLERHKGYDTSGLEKFTWEDLADIKREIKANILVNDAMRDVMTDLEEKFTQAGHPMSQRRKGQGWNMIRAHAWANGRTEVVTDDFLPLQHIAWNHPDHAPSAREIVLEIASVFARKASRLRETMEPVLASMEELRLKLDAATDEGERNDLMNDGFKFLRELRGIRKEARKQIKDGQEQGHDTTQIDEVLSEVERTHDWAQKRLIGDEEEDE